MCLRPWPAQYQLDQIVNANNLIYGEHLFCSGYWNLKAVVSHAGPGCLVTDPQQNLWAPGLGQAFLVDTTLHVLSCIVAGRIKHIHATPLWDDTWELVPDFYWTLLMLLFSLLISACILLL